MAGVCTNSLPDEVCEGEQMSTDQNINHQNNENELANIDQQLTLTTVYFGIGAIISNDHIANRFILAQVPNRNLDSNTLDVAAYTQKRTDEPLIGFILNADSEKTDHRGSHMESTSSSARDIGELNNAQATNSTILKLSQIESMVAQKQMEANQNIEKPVPHFDEDFDVINEIGDSFATDSKVLAGSSNKLPKSGAHVEDASTRKIPKTKRKPRKSRNKSVLSSQNTKKSPAIAKRLKCDVCEYSTVYQTTLTRHMRTHTGERRFQCEFCGKSFTARTSLNRHIKIHGTQFSYQCSHCRQGFSRKDSLDRHEKRCTTKQFECHLCGKRFYQHQVNLEVHMRRRHTGEKPFTCPKCGRSFIQTSHFARHSKSCT